jgi:hypothetical protein
MTRCSRSLISSPAQPLGEHAAHDRRGDLLSMGDVLGRTALLSEAVVRERPVHSLDDIATLAHLAQRRLGPRGDRPAADLHLGRQPHALQPAGAGDQQRPVAARGLHHVAVGPQVGERVARLLLRDQHPVEAGEALGVHLALELAADLLLGLPTQLQCHDLAGPFADAVGNVVAGDVEDFPVVGGAAHQHVGVRVASVVVINRDPVEPGAEVGLHRLHQVAGGLPQVGQLDAVLGGDDEAELVAVVAAPVEEGAAVLGVALGGIDLALVAVAVDAVALQIAQVGVHRLGADETATARRATLRVELHDPRLQPGGG